MTPRQIERIKKKISDVRNTLLSEKRKYGAIHDGRGLRYLPLRFYIEIADYSGGLAYTKWFDKNFPDEKGFPVFLFERTILLFKKRKIKEAGKKAFETFCANTRLFDNFFGNQMMPVDEYENAEDETAGFLSDFSYSARQPGIADFAEWLKALIGTERFKKFSERFLAISKELNKEQDDHRREYLQEAADLLVIHFNDESFQPDKLYFSE